MRLFWSKPAAIAYGPYADFPFEVGPPSGNPDDGGPILNEVEICFNGIGPNAHESFWISREKQKESYAEFCRTERKPYDLLVAATLILMEKHAPGTWVIVSSGTLDDFAQACEWIESTLGYFVVPEVMKICERSDAHDQQEPSAPDRFASPGTSG